MSVSIRKIEIFNFRSIRSITVRPHDMAILVGQNDAGKSNILRALNLFFNGETEPDVPFDFPIDHNVDNRPRKKAQECRIRLELSIPDAYKETNGDYIIWEKRWRQSGEITERSGYWGIRDTVGPRGGRKMSHVDIPPRSNLHSLLRNINFVYIPAIKDKSYLSKLRGQIYNVIAEVAADRFLASSSEFEQSISEHLRDLTDEVSRTMGLESRLALPRDLSHIFESLDFLNTDRNISLAQRGDGIKTRHVPVILRFMADKMHTLQGRGAPPYSFIWGYEEPENNQELESSINLADQLTAYLQTSIAQILVTTHSPVFYNINKHSDPARPAVSSHHTYWDPDGSGTKQETNPEDLDEHMGTMRLFAPYVDEVTERIRQEQKARSEAEQHIREHFPHVYVEGESDRIVVTRALEIFAPDAAPQIRITSKEYGGGHSYVKDMLSAWRHMHKHHSHLPKAAGVVDSDEPGKQCKRAWNGEPGNVESAKCFTLPTPQHLREAKRKGFHIPVVLEALYKKPIWDGEYENNNLSRTDLRDIVPATILQDSALNDGQSLDSFLSDQWGLFVKYKIPQKRKGPLARKLASLSGDDARWHLSEFEPLINEIVAYLLPATSPEDAEEE